MEHGTYPLKIQVPAPSINKLLNSCPCDKENPIRPPTMTLVQIQYKLAELLLHLICRV